MDFLKKLSPEWSLRIGFGVMYLYSGQSLINNPTAWKWAVPFWLRKLIETVVPLETYLKIQGAGEIFLALILFAWFLKPKIVKWAAALSALEMAGILLLGFIPFSETNFFFTFRDIGLLGGAVALTTILFQKEREMHENT